MDILNNFSFEKSVFKIENSDSAEYGVDGMENDFTYHYSETKNILNPMDSDNDNKQKAPDNPSDKGDIYFEFLSDDIQNENSTMDDSVINELDDDVIIEMEYFNNKTKEVNNKKTPLCIDLDHYSPITDKKLSSVKSEPSKSSDISSDIKILDVRSLSKQDNNWIKNDDDNTKDDIYIIEKDDCEVEFVRTNCVNPALQTHRAGVPWTCGICFMEFRNISQMLKHMRTHKDDKLFECGTCFERFSRKSDLTNHMLIHINEPHQCYICSMTFNRKIDYNNHMRIHTGGHAYRCNICSIGFSEKRHLTNHLKIHTDDKPFTCEICSLKFKWKYLLTRHRRIHPE